MHWLIRTLLSEMFTVMQDEDLNNESFEDLCLGLHYQMIQLASHTTLKKKKSLHPRLISHCHYSTLADRSHSDIVGYAGRRDLQMATLICRTDRVEPNLSL